MTYDHWTLPRATSRCLSTLGVRDHWWLPVTIFLVIPVGGLCSLSYNGISVSPSRAMFWQLTIGDHAGFVVQPIIGLLSRFVGDLEWGILIPILWLGCFGCDESAVRPIDSQKACTYGQGS